MAGSMIGEEDDDIETLLEQCRNQVERPRMAERQEAPAREPAGTINQAQPVATSSGRQGQGDNELSTTLKQFMEQTGRLMSAMAYREEKEEKEREKRKERLDVSYKPEEPYLHNYEAYCFKDDAHENLDLELRQMLRPINRCPTTYWVKGAFKQVQRPILGASLYLDHLMPGHINEGTLCKHHDQGAFIELKNYYSKNSGVGKEKKRKLDVDVENLGYDQFSMGVKTVWDQTESVWDVVDGGFNYVAAEFMTRSYSYTGIAMMRCLHECRYFCGVSPTPKKQRDLLESFFNKCFEVGLKFQVWLNPANSWS